MSFVPAFALCCSGYVHDDDRYVVPHIGGKVRPVIVVVEPC